MDQKALIETLNNIFCQTNRKDKRYSEVSLSDADFGGMYHSGKYVLNVKAELQIDNCNEEIFSIIKLLSEKAPHALENIWRVVVYNPDDSWHCYGDNDKIVYTFEDTCGR